MWLTTKLEFCVYIATPKDNYTGIRVWVGIVVIINLSGCSFIFMVAFLVIVVLVVWQVPSGWPLAFGTPALALRILLIFAAVPKESFECVLDRPVSREPGLTEIRLVSNNLLTHHC
jgi:hypothetical protein